MAYIGNEPVIGQWRKLDDISGSFNGSLTSFTTQVGGTNVTAGSANQLLVSLGGVLQEPGTDYSVSSSTITFTTAPAASLSFFAVLAGDALNTSVPADGSITTAKLGANLTVDLGLGSAGTPSLTFDADTGLFSGGDNQVNVSTSGVERAEFGASEVVFNDGGADYDFRVEGDTNANLLVVDASTDRVGLGTSSPDTILTVSTPNVAVTSQSSNVNIYANDALAADIGGSIGLGATWNGTGGLINYASIHGKKANATSGNTDGYMSFVVRDNGGTKERLRILSDGTLRLLNSTGIDFSQIQTDSGSATSEILDSYEEGTWTPSLGGTTVYYTREGYYTKIGNLVYVYCNIHVNTIGTGSPTTINGLPFTPGLGEQTIPVAYFDSVATSVYWFSFRANLAGTLSSRAQTALDGTSAQVNIFGNATQVIATGVYQV